MKQLIAAIFVAISPASILAAEALSYDVVFDDKVIAAGTDTLSTGDRIIINDRLLENGDSDGED